MDKFDNQVNDLAGDQKLKDDSNFDNNSRCNIESPLKILKKAKPALKQ